MTAKTILKVFDTHFFKECCFYFWKKKSWIILKQHRSAVFFFDFHLFIDCEPFLLFCVMLSLYLPLLHATALIDSVYSVRWWTSICLLQEIFPTWASIEWMGVKRVKTSMKMTYTFMCIERRSVYLPLFLLGCFFFYYIKSLYCFYTCFLKRLGWDANYFLWLLRFETSWE